MAQPQVTIVSKGGTGKITLTNHGVVLGQGTAAVAITTAGTAGQVLTSNGAAADPTFQAATGGLGDPGANGVVVRTALNTTTARTLTGTANQVIIANGDGVAGNPTFSTPQDIGTASSVTFGGVTTNGLTNMNGAQKIKRTTSAAGAYTVLSTDYLIAKTGITGGGDTVTLPDPTTNANQAFEIVDESGTASTNNLTLAVAVAGNIDGASTYVINLNNGSVKVYSNGANYFTLN